MQMVSVPTSACSFCFQTKALQHVVSSHNSYLQGGRYTWRHNSVLLHLAKTLSSVTNSSFYADLPFFLSPLIPGDSLLPDLGLVRNKFLCNLLELTIGFPANIKINKTLRLLNISLLLLTSRNHTRLSNLQLFP